ncbi:hypothetical protein Hanom_Chr08g00689571 [Helianthus anomalus]
MLQTMVPNSFSAFLTRFLSFYICSFDPLCDIGHPAEKTSTVLEKSVTYRLSWTFFSVNRVVRRDRSLRWQFP